MYHVCEHVFNQTLLDYYFEFELIKCDLALNVRSSKILENMKKNEKVFAADCLKLTFVSNL